MLNCVGDISSMFYRMSLFLEYTGRDVEEWSSMCKTYFQIVQGKKKKMVCPHSAKTEQVCGRPTSGNWWPHHPFFQFFWWFEVLKRSSWGKKHLRNQPSSPLSSHLDSSLYPSSWPTTAKRVPLKSGSDPAPPLLSPPVSAIHSEQSQSLCCGP